MALKPSFSRLQAPRLTDRIGLLVIALITLAASALVFWGGIFIGQDSATQFYPWYDYLGERLRDGDIPGWNPFQFAGVPFTADPQSGWMYLPAMLIFTVLPLAYAVPVFIAFHLALAGTGTYILSRLLGIGVGGAVVAGAAYQLAPPIYGRSVCCPAQYEVGSWMPIALVGAELAMRSRSWNWRLIGWAIGGVATSQALGAWLGQGGYYFLMFLAAYIAYRGLIAPNDRGEDWRGRFVTTLKHGAAVFSIGFGLAAGGILPRLEYISRSNVAGGEYGDATFWASEIGGLTPGMIFDRLLNPTLYYPGVAVLILSISALFLARRRHAAPFFAGVGICAIILATPWDTPLHLFLYAVLPKFEQLHQHWPERVAIVAYLTFAMLAGAAVQSLVSRRVSTARMLMVVSVPIIALVAVILANAEVPTVPVIVLFVTIALIAAMVLPQTKWLRPLLPAFFVVVVALDLLIAFNGATAEGPYGGFHRVDIEEYYDPAGAATFLQNRMADEPGRYIGYDPEQRVIADSQVVLYRYDFASPDTTALLVNNLGVLHGIEDAQGYNPVQPKRFVEFLTALNGQPQEYHDANIYPSGLNSPLLDLLNIRYIVIPATYSADRTDLSELDQTFPTIYSDDHVQVLENPDAFPRAWVVHDAQQIETDEVLPLLGTGDVDPRETALLETTPPQLESPSSAATSSATIIEDETEMLRLETQADAPGLLVMSESYDPNWRAYVDGEEVDLYRANYLQRAVPIPAGAHIVELRYEPLPLKLGLGVSALTGAILLGGLGWSAWHVRRQDSGGSQSPQRSQPER